MAIEKITVPDLGDAADVEIIELLVAVGDTVAENDSLLSDPVLAWSMVGIGAVLLVAETIIIVLALLNRPKQ